MKSIIIEENINSEGTRILISDIKAGYRFLKEFRGLIVSLYEAFINFH